MTTAISRSEKKRPPFWGAARELTSLPHRGCHLLLIFGVLSSELDISRRADQQYEIGHSGPAIKLWPAATPVGARM